MVFLPWNGWHSCFHQLILSFGFILSQQILLRLQLLIFILMCDLLFHTIFYSQIFSCYSFYVILLKIWDFSVNPWSPSVERNIGFSCTIYVPPCLKGLNKVHITWMTWIYFSAPPIVSSVNMLSSSSSSSYCPGREGKGCNRFLPNVSKDYHPAPCGDNDHTIPHLVPLANSGVRISGILSFVCIRS